MRASGLLQLVAGVILLAGCSPEQGLEIFNETGVPLSMRVVVIKTHHGVETRSFRQQRIAIGRMDFFSELIVPPRVVISAGRCEYDYGSFIEVQERTHEGRIRFRLEPDFSARLLTLQRRAGESGYFPDDAMEGFPITPVRTCR